MGVQFHGTWSNYSAADRATILDKLVAAGAEWVRIDIGWASYEYTGPGQIYAWYANLADAAVNEANARGLKVLAVLWGSPTWANGNQDPRFPPADPQAYASFARWAAEHYRGRVAAWEVWNEPNLDEFWAGADPAAYTALLRAAYPAFKAGDPGAPVVLGGTSYNDTDYLAAVYANGGQGSFDILATHPYMGPSDLPPETPDDGTEWTLAHVRAVHDLMVSRGDGGKPIWFTEFGWSTHANTGGEPNWQRGVTDEQQGDFLVRTLRWTAQNAPYVTNVFWYNERNQQSGGVHLDGYGLLRAGPQREAGLRGDAGVPRKLKQARAISHRVGLVVTSALPHRALRTLARRVAPHGSSPKRAERSRARAPSRRASSGDTRRSMVAAASRGTSSTGTRAPTASAPSPRTSRMPSTSAATTLHPQASASSATKDMPSHRDGCTTTSAATSHARTSCWRPTNRTSGSACRSRRSSSGPSPTRTSAAFDTEARTSDHAASRRSWPFCAARRPTHTTVGARASSPNDTRIFSRSPGSAGANFARSTALGTTRQLACNPASSPRARSASLTHRIEVVQRVARRSHDRDSAGATRLRAGTTTRSA